MRLRPALLAATVLLLAGCSNRTLFGGPVTTATATPTAAPTATSSASASATATSTSSQTASPTATATTGANVLSMVVNGGLAGNVVDQATTSVTICTPGSTTACQTITNIVVDSGSVGLRIFSSALNSSISLQQVTVAGQPEGVCTAFADGSLLWGPLQTAGLQLGGESQVSAPVEVIADTGFAGIPTACSNQGSKVITSPSQAGYNGILGVGPFASDNGSVYFACSGAACTALTGTSTAEQVGNPIVALPADNNGLVVELPGLGGSGAPTASGSLILGIGTQANNALGSATVYTTDSFGNVTTLYNAIDFGSFFDTGSNGFFFQDSTITGCTGGDSGFYCPASTLALSAQVTGHNGASGTVAFSIANATALFSTGNTAFNNIGGSFPGPSFDWGLPFFFGRNVFIAIEGRSTPGGTGPYIAY